MGTRSSVSTADFPTRLASKEEAGSFDKGECPRCRGEMILQLENLEDGEQVWECGECAILAIWVANTNEAE